MNDKYSIGIDPYDENAKGIPCVVTVGGRKLGKAILLESEFSKEAKRIQKYFNVTTVKDLDGVRPFYPSWNEIECSPKVEKTFDEQLEDIVAHVITFVNFRIYLHKWINSGKDDMSVFHPPLLEEWKNYKP